MWRVVTATRTAAVRAVVAAVAHVSRVFRPARAAVARALHAPVVLDVPPLAATRRDAAAVHASEWVWGREVCCWPACCCAADRTPGTGPLVCGACSGRCSDVTSARLFTVVAAGAAPEAPTGDANKWGVAEVQAWLETYDNGIWAPYAPKFAELDGARLSALPE